MKLDWRITGLAEIENMLAELPKAAAGNLGVRALRRGARVILLEARRHAPVGDRASLGGKSQPGQLKRAIKIIVHDRERGRRRMSVIVTNKDAGINPYWIEYGTGPRIAKSRDGFLYFKIRGKLIRARRVKGVPARPFMRVAADIGGPRAIRAIVEALPVELEKEATRLAKKGARAKP